MSFFLCIFLYGQGQVVKLVADYGTTLGGDGWMDGRLPCPSFYLSFLSLSGLPSFIFSRFP